MNPPHKREESPSKPKTTEPLGEGGVLVAQAHQLAGRLFSRILKEHGIDELNPAQGRIVYALWREDGLTQGELATRTKLDKSTLTLMLTRLEEAGQVVRKAASSDARIRRVYLTARNRKLHETYRAASEEMFSHYYKGLRGSEIAVFESMLRLIIGNLEAALD
jgi:MarR family transcriptional regulator, organic hydroperoxide resistance regulator